MHLGSLYTALASYLDARHHSGRWLLRIDDLDTPRNVPGSVERIMDCLLAFGLQWDDEVYFQSAHQTAYTRAIDQLHAQHRLYACDCSRKLLNAQPGIYPGSCRNRQLSLAKHALRVQCDQKDVVFFDSIQGQICENPGLQHGDFIVRRRDGIVAYQLAVVVDDHMQQVNHVLRGFDLLESTPRQIFLHELLGFVAPSYLHVPIIVDKFGNKLSKQTYAEAVSSQQPVTTLFLLLTLLRQNPPDWLRYAPLSDVLAWGIAHWQPKNLCKTTTIEPLT